MTNAIRSPVSIKITNSYFCAQIYILSRESYIYSMWYQRKTGVQRTVLWKFPCWRCRDDRDRLCVDEEELGYPESNLKVLGPLRQINWTRSKLTTHKLNPEKRQRFQSLPHFSAGLRCKDDPDSHCPSKLDCVRVPQWLPCITAALHKPADNYFLKAG